MTVFRFFCLLFVALLFCTCVAPAHLSKTFDGKSKVVFIINHFTDSAYTKSGSDNYIVLFSNYLEDTTISFGIQQPNRYVPLCQNPTPEFFIVSQKFGLNLFIDGEWYYINLSPEYPHVWVNLDLVEEFFDRSDFEVNVFLGEKVKYCVSVMQYQKCTSRFGCGN